MSDKWEDPTTENKGAAEGARGDGDENPQDYRLPGPPPPPPPPLLLIKGNGGEKWMQHQRTHMPIKNFLIKTTFIWNNFLTKRADGIPETPTPENILSEEDQEKVLEKAEKDIKEIWPNSNAKVLWGKKGPTKGVPILLGKKKRVKYQFIERGQ